MELWRLHYFVVVAEEEHVSRAAERLNVSQSPLSRQIRHLEAELGVALFSREGRGVQLTSAGRVAYELACELLAKAERVEFSLKALGKGEVGPVRVGYVQGAAYNGTLPKTLARLQSQAPGIEPKLTVMRSQEQVAAVLSGELDVGFVHAQVEDKNLIYRHLFCENFILAVSAEQADAIAEVSIETLTSLPWIMPPRTPPSDIRTHLEFSLEQLGFTPSVVLETTDIPTALSFVASGFGVALVQESIVRILPPGVMVLPVSVLDLQIHTGVVWHANRINPLIQRFLQALPAEVGSV